jgi:hypothetical protein
MARNKINYAAQGFFVGPSPATGYHFATGTCGTDSGVNTTLVNELYRIQGIDYSFNFQKDNLGQFGDLAPIDLVAVNAPTVNFNYSYLSSNFLNEKNIGFVISSGNLVNCLSGILSDNEDRNYFLAIHAPDGEDLHNNPNFNLDSNGNIIGFGNSVITNYSFNAAVGSFPTVNIQNDALNMVIYDKNNSIENQIYGINLRNGGLDNVNGFSGTYIFENFNVVKPDAFVKITADPINIHSAPNPDLNLITNLSTDSVFNGAGTGTNWETNNAFASVFRTGNQLVYQKLTGLNVLRLPFVNLDKESSSKWYKLIVDIASGSTNLTNPASNNLKANFGDISQPDFTLFSGINTFYNSGIAGTNIISINFPQANITGTVYFNNIQLFEPKNYSAYWQHTGATAGSSTQTLNSLAITGYNFKNNQRYKINYFYKASGNYTSNQNPVYVRFGLQSSFNMAGLRESVVVGENGPNGTSWISNDAILTYQYLHGLTSEARIVRDGVGSDTGRAVWLDDISITELNELEILNRTSGNGSFEEYFTNPIGTGVGTIRTFSGWNITSNPGYLSYLSVTGITAGSLDSSDPYKENSSLAGHFTLINHNTGNSSYIIAENTGINPLRAGKRHTATFYARASGATPSQTKNLEFYDGFRRSGYYVTPVTFDNTWNRYGFQFIPTGNTNLFWRIPFSTVNTVGDSFSIDRIIIAEHTDCYNLPTVETGMGGFNLPYSTSTTNFSGFATNADRRSISVLKPQDAYLTFTYNDFGVSVTDWKLQSVSLDLPINREDIYSIDNRYPEKRITYPIIGNLTLEAICGDYQTGSLHDYYMNCNKSYDIKFGIRSPCNADLVGIEHYLKESKLNSISWSDSVGGIGKTANLNFSFFIGGPLSTGAGWYLSGITNL